MEIKELMKLVYTEFKKYSEQKQVFYNSIEKQNIDFEILKIGSDFFKVKNLKTGEVFKTYIRNMYNP